MTVQTPTEVKSQSRQMTSFLAALEASGATERQRDAHRSAVERLGEFMAPRDPLTATTSDLRGFLAYLGELGVSQQSQGVYQCAIEKWLAHVREFGFAEAPEGDGEATGVLDYSADPDPVDCEQTWPHRSLKQPHAVALAVGDAAAGAAAAGAAAAGSSFPDTSAPGLAFASADFGSAFDAAAAAARQAETVVMTGWADDSVPAEPEILAWTDPRVAAPPPPAPVSPAPEPTPFAFAAPVPPAPMSPAPEPTPFAFAAPVPPPAPEIHRTFMTPAIPSAADFVPAPAASGTSPFTLEAEAGAVGESTMMLPSGFVAPSPVPPPAFPAPPPATPEAVPDARAVSHATPELPAFLRAPAMPVPRDTTQDTFDPGFSQPAAPDTTSKRPGKSIALASVPEDMSFGAVSADEVSPAPEPVMKGREPRMGDDTLEGWALRTSHSERKDLSLAEIRNMALAGTITARTMVRRPGGDWMPAGEFAPLRAVFTTLADGSKNNAAARERVPPHAQPLPPALAMILAWAGAAGGAFVAGLGWWLGAIIAGQEVFPLAALGGVFGGFAATWLSRCDGRIAAIPGAVAGAASALIGRYLVFETLRSGVVTFGALDPAPDLLPFIQSGLTATFAISLVASVLLGALLGFFGVGRPH